MTATAEGSVRIIFQDASGTRRDVVYGETRTEALRAAAASTVATDPRVMQNVAFGGRVPLGQDDQLVVEMKGDSATVVDSGATIRIPVTVQNIKTGVIRETFLTGSDLGLTATDVTINTTWTVVGSYTINAQERLTLGHRNQANSQILMCLVYT